MKKTAFFIDAYALIYRSFFAFSKNPRITSYGLNTSAIFGFINSLLEVIEKENPDYMAVAFDKSGKTIRHEYFPEYKANREKQPEDITKSIPFIKQLLEAFNIPVLEAEGYEADDIIGTLSYKADTNDIDVYMMTPDKDYAQLVNESVYMYKPSGRTGKLEKHGISEVCNKFEIEHPKQVIDILALWGDSSDNVPGIPGIGEKTAKALIKKYGSVEKLLENTHELKGKQKENVEKFAEQALLSKKLVTILLDVPVEFDYKTFKTQKPDFDSIIKIFDELEFKTLKNRLYKLGASLSQNLFSGIDDAFDIKEQKIDDISTIKHDYKLCDSETVIEELIAKINHSLELCFDTETTGLDPHSAELVGISFSVKEHEAYYLPVPPDKSAAKEILKPIKPILENPDILKIGQNIKYDISVLKWYDIDVKGRFFDTMIAHYLLQPDMKHNMDYLSEQYLNYKPISIETLIGKKGAGQGSMRSVPVKKVLNYAAEDADITYRLFQYFRKEIKNSHVSKLFYDIEMPLISVLACMECMGVTVDLEALTGQRSVLVDILIKIENAIYEFAGTNFNISSPKQLGEILFAHMQLDAKAKRMKSGQYSTSEEVLRKLEHKHPIIAKILEYRSLKKLITTYIDALPKLVNNKTNRIHTSYNQAVVNTGRLSSTNPNLQNIPIRSNEGKEIRKAFVPRDDNYTFFSADYSQIELRIMAHLSEDKHLTNAFNENKDIHKSTAAKVFKVSEEKVDSDMRRAAKTVNFGIIYGISAFGLSQRLSISRSEASNIIKTYFNEFPGIKEYMDYSIKKARDTGYAETIFGRRRYLKDINSRNGTVRGFAERNAINMPIQGTAADIIKIAMINIHNYFNENNLKSKMIMQVHDELNFDLYKAEQQNLAQKILNFMEQATTLKIPLVVDSNFGKNWYEAH